MPFNFNIPAFRKMTKLWRLANVISVLFYFCQYAFMYWKKLALFIHSIVLSAFLYRNYRKKFVAATQIRNIFRF